MFSKIIGNNQVKTTFQRLLRSGRLPNSLLFVGENGVGKKPFALELAKAFVCRNPSDGEACDKCSACQRADKFEIPKVEESTKVDESLKNKFKKVFFSEHPDVAIISPLKKNILVDAIRNIEDESNFRPFEAKARFFIIEDAHKMNEEASNALLKTLEEPPSTSHIFLLTSRPDALLQTIRSRCQRVRFAPVKNSEIKDHLLSTKKFAPDDAELLAGLSRGSIGRALNLDLGKFREQREAILKVLESLLINRNRAVLLKVAEEMNDQKNKDSYEDYLEILQTVIHDIWTLNLGENTAKISNADLKNQLERLSQHADRNRLAIWLKEIEILRENFTVNLNKKIATDSLFMQMAG